MQSVNSRWQNSTQVHTMAKAAAIKNPLAKYHLWSVTDWSIHHELLTLNLWLFVGEPKRRDQEMYYRASWRFVHPVRVHFSRFVPSGRAVIQKIHVLQSPKKDLNTYRFEFEDDSFIEVVARDCSTVQW